MKVTVRLFAELREKSGDSKVILEVPADAAGRELWERLVAVRPALGGLPYRPLLARNGTYASWEEPLQEGDEVAFLAPVGGG